MAELSPAPARILIADDDEVMCGFCLRAMAAAGHTPRAVHSAAAALATLRSEGPFDLLLADIQMPGLDGIELTRIARELDPAIAVVIMTGHSSPATLHASVRRGVADYLTKPFELDELTVVVAQALDKRRLLQESLRLRAVEQLLASSEILNGTLEREALAHTLVQLARTQLPAAVSFLLLADQDPQATLVISNPPGATLLPAGRDAIAQSLKACRALRLTAPTPLGTLASTAFHHGLVVGLRNRGEPIGALVLCDEQPHFAPVGSEEILSLLANQASTALRNAHLYGQLETAYQDLRELDRLKSEFIAIASHELRSPLAIVLGYATMVHDRTEGEPRQFAARLVEGAQRIKAIVDDLLRLHDVDRLEIALVQAPASLEDLVRGVVERFLAQAKQKNLAIQLALPPEPVIFDLDCELAQLVLGNLLANALKFTPSGGQVTLEAARWSQAQLTAALSAAPPNPTIRRLSLPLAAAWAVVHVHDTGIGIPREHQQRIFERFYQAAHSLTREQGGTGLGLAIAGDLASLQGGVIWLSSNEGQGSSFSFALPLTILSSG
ncbi:MAG: ATP-binding protein [Oscillochloridaceae bacterium umkhey_bin13]